MKAPVKEYYKYELARLYQHDRRTFVKRMRKCCPDLRNTGYHPSQRKLTIKQVEIIFLALGRPNSVRNAIVQKLSDLNGH